MLTLHSLQTEVEIIATNPLCACGKIASVIEYWLRFVFSVSIRKNSSLITISLSRVFNDQPRDIIYIYTIVTMEIGM